MADWIVTLVKVGLGLGCFIFLALIFLTIPNPRTKDRTDDKGQELQGADQGD